MARVLLVDDDEQMRRAMELCLAREGYDVVSATNGRSALGIIDSTPVEVIVTDERMPELSGLELLKLLNERGSAIPLIMITAYGTVNQAVEAMQAGATDFLMKPFAPDELTRVVARALDATAVDLPTRERKAKVSRPIITNDPLMIRILEIAEAVARSDATVLIQGESGTGKELIARLIHTASGRSSHPFVAVNCAALPESLLESELFGHEKGSFTGAQARKIGKFEMAHGGTILLDEISEMDIVLQAKLLRVLQEREVDRVGGKEPVNIDVRVLATTNRNLESMVADGRFRADLFYRLNVIPLTIPSLRVRRSDVRLLIHHFMRKYLGSQATAVPVDVLRTLEEYPWPGNVRELQNAVERAAILSRGGPMTTEHFLLQSNVGVSRGIHDGTLVDGSTGASEGSEGLAAAANIRSQPEVLHPGFASDGSPTTIVPSSLRASIELERVDSVVDEESKAVDLRGDTASRTMSPGAVGLTIRPGMTVHEMERHLIMETLRATGDNRTQAAKLLRISIRTLRNKLNGYRS